MSETSTKKSQITFDEFKKSVLIDFELVCKSRETSLMGRREVLSGKGSFGIFGDGKELAQIAMARCFKKGDFRSGYYRDQTFMMAINEMSVTQFFAALYGHADINFEPQSGGRQMVAHFSTSSLNEAGSWKDISKQFNSASDISCTAGQMPRLVGLAQASKYYRQSKLSDQWKKFSNKGNEIAWGTIGNASTSEGHFFESINAAGVLQIPMVISVWDDNYGISVHSKDQTTKENISEILKGFQRTKKDKGFEIIKVKEWIILNEFASEEDLKEIEKKCKKFVSTSKNEAWKNYQKPILEEAKLAIQLLTDLINESENGVFINPIKEKLELDVKLNPHRKNIFSSLKEALRIVRSENLTSKAAIKNSLKIWNLENQDRYSSHLYSQSKWASLNVKEVKPTFNESSIEVDARVILRDNFDQLLKVNPEILIFGEDSGQIGGVNQGLEGLQSKHGLNRVSDTGIREATILGQGIGMAMRGLRPIAEIQYLDYLLYSFQGMSDDLSTLHYRTKGKQKAPLIIRTRGHRLEGIWHSGSPLGMMLNGLRGMNVLVPRNMTKAAGFYNTLLQSDDPAIVVECLNGYRLKEKMPSNLSLIRTPIGISEITKEGTDITIVTYGSTWRIVSAAAQELQKIDISCEVIDVQSLLPFDVNHAIAESIKKTNKVLFVDEDVSSGATAYMMQKVIEEQKAYFHLDCQPQTLSAKDHRPAYGEDGDYFSKPNGDDVFDKVYAIMNEYNPSKFSKI